MQLPALRSLPPAILLLCGVGGGVSALGAVGVGVEAVCIEPAELLMQPEEVAPAAWNGPPLRIALIADLHVGSPYVDLASIRTLVARTNDQHPDLVLLLGDYANDVLGGEPVPVASYAPLLGELEAPLGVFAVLGNHDWWSRAGGIREAIGAEGIPVLENTSRLLWAPGGGFWLVGVGDSTTLHAGMAGAIRALPQDGLPVLAMTHNPEVFDDMPSRVALLVAGHNHGGQVALPWIGSPLLLSYPRGVYEARGQSLVVTSGVGTSFLPLRLGVPPEVMILTVRPVERVAGSWSDSLLWAVLGVH